MHKCHFVKQFLCNYQKQEAGQTPPVPPPSPPSAGGGHACGHASAVRRLVRSPEVQNNLEMNHGVCMLHTSSKLLTTTEWRPWIDASLSHHAPVPHAYFLSPFAHPPLPTLHPSLISPHSSSPPVRAAGTSATFMERPITFQNSLNLRTVPCPLNPLRSTRL